MPVRRSDADGRRFFDEFQKVRVSRFRATGVIDPKKREAIIPFPNGRLKLINTAHVHLKHGGGYSYFLCPRCMKLRVTLYLIDDAPLCVGCCAKFNIRDRSRYGWGRAERLRARQVKLDELMAKLTSTEPLQHRTPAAWWGKRRLMANSRRLTVSARRKMIALRLSQIAWQQAGHGVQGYAPLPEAKLIVKVKPIWKARTFEDLERALDAAQASIIEALNSDDPKIRIAAAKLMMRTKQGRELGLG